MLLLLLFIYYHFGIIILIVIVIVSAAQDKWWKHAQGPSGPVPTERLCWCCGVSLECWPLAEPTALIEKYHSKADLEFNNDFDMCKEGVCFLFERSEIATFHFKVRRFDCLCKSNVCVCVCLQVPSKQRMSADVRVRLPRQNLWACGSRSQSLAFRRVISRPTSAACPSTSA